MTMSIEKYRKTVLTEREEWDANFNGKKCSIEALDSIIIKKKGEGPEKPLYNCSSSGPGPYYDPSGIHLHIWKSIKNIKNFNGEQNQNVKHVQFTDYNSGYYCAICHSHNKNSSVKWIQSPESSDDIPEITKRCVNHVNYSTIDNYISFPPTAEIKETKHVVPRSYRNWNTLMYKVLHVMKFNKIEYKISNSKVLKLWPWDLTPYQKFKLKFPLYKNSNIFLNSLDIFTETYAYIT